MWVLNKCPFCGSNRVKVHGYRLFYVRCGECGLQGPRDLIKYDAAAKWNDLTEKVGKSEEVE